MGTDRSLKKWIKERRRQGLIALLGVALAIVVYLNVDGDSDAGSLIQGLALSVIFAAVAYLFANYILYSDELEPERIYQRIREIVKDKGLREVAQHAPAVDWNRFLNEPPAMVVEGFARYLDGPLDDEYDAFAAFFRRGGKMTLVLPQEDQALAADIAQQFDPAIGVKPERILGRIATTRRILERAGGSGRESGATEGALRIVASPAATNYWGVVADGQRALFAPYDNKAMVGLRMPVFEFDLNVAQGLKKCFEHEMTSFASSDQSQAQASTSD